MPEDDRKDDGLKYDRMVEEALRSVVGRALTYAIKHGLTGDHHFYITFRTDDPGTQVPQRLRERYPGEMTIVLQYQFWDLEVTPEGFSVALSFDDIRENLVIPFPAVVAFADPSVQFGLQFDAGNSDRPAPRSSGENKDANLEDPANAASDMPGENASGENEAGDDESGDGKAPARSENVVSFDSFRKK